MSSVTPTAPLPRRRPSVVLVAAPGTLEAVDAKLRRAGVRPVRLPAVEARPLAPSGWIGPVLRGPTPDVVIVTSRAAVGAGVVPWRRTVGRLPRPVEYWAVGPGTARELRRIGIRRSHRPTGMGASALARTVGRRKPRTILYFRSDRAGPALARGLRRRGHRVRDVVVYRLGPSRPFSVRNRGDLARASVLVVTSPSGLEELRGRLDRAAFGHLARNVRTVVLGERSRRKARAYGFRHLSVLPPATAQRFTRHLLDEVRHARA